MKASILPNFGHKNVHNFKTVCPMKLKFQIIIELKKLYQLFKYLNSPRNHLYTLFSPEKQP